LFFANELQRTFGFDCACLEFCGRCHPVFNKGKILKMRRRSRKSRETSEKQSESEDSDPLTSSGQSESESEGSSQSESESEDSQSESDNESELEEIPEKYKIEFKEVLPYLRRGDLEELYTKKGDKIDLSNHFDCRSTEILITVSKILNKKSPKPMRGDIFKFAFLKKEQQEGYFFWNGRRAILPEKDDTNDDEENEACYIVPAEFKVPTEFSVNYWKDSGFTNFSTRALCYDTIDMKFASEHYGKNGDTIKAVTELGFRKFIAKDILEFLNYNLEEIFTSDNILGAFISVYYDNSHECYVILFYEEEGKKEALAEFFNTGRCCCYDGWEDIVENSITDRKRLQNVIRKVNNKVLNKDRCVYVQYLS
jgi:hypothetical protein